MVTNEMTVDYIQFSKKVTKWSMFLVTMTLILCVLLIAFNHFQQYIINAITSLYTSYITIMGITVGAYQGNSSLEKWSRAKYQFDIAMKQSNHQQIEEDVIDDIENTYG